MAWTAGKASGDDHPILYAAIDLVPRIAEAREQLEQGRRIPPSLAEAMKDAGIFGMVMPHAWGGPELDPLTQYRIIETLAMADGSVGWCAMIGCDSGYISAFLDQDVARAMYPDIRVATAAAATPTGKAFRVPGGYRVEGRFPFASGCQHSQWIWAGCTVIEDGTPRTDANGVPETRQCFLNLASQCEILDTWYTTGLCGTGSNDILVRETFVPEERTFSFQDPALVKRPGPLHAFPFLFIGKGPAAALGIARHALDALMEDAGKRSARRYTIGERLEPPKLLRDDVFVQEAVGRADTLLASVRGYYYDLSDDLWETLVAGSQPTEIQLARFITAHTYIIGTCVDIVQLAYKTAGGTAAYTKGPYDRCLRDILTMNQHVAGTLRTYEMAGRMILGLEPLRWLF
ncbi:MAG TPA: acyl-CoA dehydrogenase family protein [Acetobacteraceae bacterium]|nr:acyl-CoA dehydrogenase family protein [Acetobacteraceae bacterium]